MHLSKSTITPSLIPLAHEAHEFIAKDLDTFSNHLLNSIVVPRPIAFVTSMSEQGVINAAPFSYFNAVCTNPIMISVAIERKEGYRKDSALNIISTKEFVVNICSVELVKVINIASIEFPPGISEIEVTGLSLIPSEKIKVPRIANTLVQLECVFHQVIELGENQSDLILAKVVMAHVHKNILKGNGDVDVAKLNPLVRLSRRSYASLSGFFEIPKFFR